MIAFFTALNVAYHLIVLFVLAAVIWNVVGLADFKRQFMSAVLIIPLLLRVLNLK